MLSILLPLLIISTIPSSNMLLIGIVIHSLSLLFPFFLLLSFSYSCCQEMRGGIQIRFLFLQSFFTQHSTTQSAQPQAQLHGNLYQLPFGFSFLPVPFLFSYFISFLSFLFLYLIFFVCRLQVALLFVLRFVLYA